MIEISQFQPFYYHHGSNYGKSWILIVIHMARNEDNKKIPLAKLSFVISYHICSDVNNSPLPPEKNRVHHNFL